MAFAYLIDRLVDTAKGKEAFGRLLWDGDEYAAVSGPYGNGVIEVGDYTVKVRDVATGPGMEPGYCLPDDDGNNLCFFIPLQPNFSTNRTGIGIHPDGNVPGTEGCIGLQQGDFLLFWKKWNKVDIDDRPTSLTVKNSAFLIALDAPSEAELWAKQSDVAQAALAFAIKFLGCRKGDSKSDPLDDLSVRRLLTIARAVSYVESAHGTQGASQPARDPIQCGNPGDVWWKELTGQSGNGDRFARGPGLSNIWAKEVDSTAEATDGFDPGASLSTIDKSTGHNDPNFTPKHSYFWGIIFLIYKINVTAGDPSYACGDISDDRLIQGAVAYNGGGVDDYETRIRNAIKLIGGFPTISQIYSERGRVFGIKDTSAFISELIDAATRKPTRPQIHRLEVQFDSHGNLVSVSVEFE